MFRSSGHRIGFPVASRSAATLDSFRVKTPVPANNGWDTSVSKAMRCCATCWEKQRKQPHGATRTGGVGMCTWQCVDIKTLPRRPWPGNLPSAVLDVAQRLGLFAVSRIRFARGKARYRTWREVERRPFDWASRSLKRESEVVIMVEVLIEEMFRSD